MRTQVLDTNVVVRHLTGDPPAQARRATAALREAEDLLLTDVVLSECLYVLEGVYEVPRARAAAQMRALLALPAVRAPDATLLHRALDLYDATPRLDWPDAHCAAVAEREHAALLSFDRGYDALPWLERDAP
ncbi:MAG: PIN domain-containing protein [Solirubrobacteraceae bacterium]|jgi:predicted nucleic acid-binding protein|nr:PIN domain-containing protein [Solirubrobacteraceae bacterium]